LLGGTKIVFELLTDTSYAHLFDKEVVGALRKHVPWTRRLRECWTVLEGESIDLMPFTARHQERFVVKPSGGSSGEGVVLGWECDTQTWERTLKLALSRPYVVQERVFAPKERFPVMDTGNLSAVERFVDFDPYVWNATQVRGHLVRISSGQVLNLGGGGSTTARWILEPAHA
jgi:uncharacterized circularly permuted ATP-grasp superfamily protein